jgi:alpha-beta hydrolase superfamily lysophospholipase
MASAGIACVRFDAAGFGESHGTYEGASYDTLTSDLTNALNRLVEVPGIDASRIGIIGHSLGGNIAIDVASSNSLVSALCLLSPNPTQNKSDIAMFSKTQLNELETSGYTLRKRIYASQRVYEPINAGMTLKRASRVRAATLLVYGGDDPYYASEQYLRLAQAFRTPASLAEIPCADHNFLPLECRDQLIASILVWVTARFTGL